MLPTLFISHGSPDVAIAETPASAFLRDLAHRLPRPRAIVVASAHFEATGRVLVTGDAAPETIHDFGGFAPELYAMRYGAPGDPALAAAIVEALRAAGLAAAAAGGRGFDHGAWVPLALAYPEATIPVVEVSVHPAADAAYHLRLGRALSHLPQEDVLVIGSGSLTHNLREAFVHLRAGERAAAVPGWVDAFADWVADRLAGGEEEALLDYRAQAPFAARNHPTEEHLMPLFVALGAAGNGAGAETLHRSRDFGVLAMEAFAFAQAA
ncbi:DODA-type extradiol aromatic ring-opening family dioxygenase [Jiella sonneratiae]|uniref:Dioxygenase n=1 Tax=Jiella sonneratiae TaxID=2816856 RepID=A0ABS3J9X9_9HYPH|nr:class III extradiol ring-cleavage dioxygenase [Jiella sonneratiae]MBO0906484.1 dioxygenase [Jiella sonneratiae]